MLLWKLLFYETTAWTVFDRANIYERVDYVKKNTNTQ